MSRVAPKVNILTYTKASAPERFSALLPILSDPSTWNAFQGFDRPVQLIQNYQYLQSGSIVDLFKRIRIRNLARRFIKTNDYFFQKDIEDTELWLRQNASRLENYLSMLPNLTFIPWHTHRIDIAVHAINYAFAHNETIVLGIRPPDIQKYEFRTYLLLHEFAHINLNNFISYIESSTVFNEAAGEILAMYYAHTLLTESTSVALEQWSKHNLTPKDFTVLSKGMILCENQTDIKTLFTHPSIKEIVARYKPHNIKF